MISIIFALGPSLTLATTRLLKLRPGQVEYRLKRHPLHEQARADRDDNHMGPALRRAAK